MAAPTTVHVHSYISSDGGVIVLYIRSLSTNKIGRYLNYIQKRKSVACGDTHAVTLRGDTHNDFLGPCMDFLVTSYTHTQLQDCEVWRKACSLLCVML